MNIVKSRSQLPGIWRVSDIQDYSNPLMPESRQQGTLSFVLEGVKPRAVYVSAYIEEEESMLARYQFDTEEELTEEQLTARRNFFTVSVRVRLYNTDEKSFMSKNIDQKLKPVDTTADKRDNAYFEGIANTPHLNKAKEAVEDFIWKEASFFRYMILSTEQATERLISGSESSVPRMKHSLFPVHGSPVTDILVGKSKHPVQFL